MGNRHRITRSLVRGSALAIVTSLATVVHAQTAAPVAPAARQEGGDIAAGFRNPPQSARPQVWWHWMNGNITKDGITKDIQWMSDIGIGGLQNFDAALQTPQMVDKRLIYMTPEWKDAFRYAAQLADQRGLEFTVAASPGWSETGGPWVKPADGMKKLVWSEIIVNGGRKAPIVPAPPTITGPFQDMARVANFAANSTGKADPVHYADIAVLAFPLPANGAPLPLPKLTAGDGKSMDAARLNDGGHATSVELAGGTAEAPAVVVADFGAPRQVRSFSLSMARQQGVGLSPAQPVNPVLEVERDGVWTKITDVSLEGGVQSTVAFAPITARRFRVVLNPRPARGLSALGSVPGAVMMALGTPPGNKPVLRLAELRFSDEDRVDRFEQKAAFALADDYTTLDRPGLPAAAGVRPAQVLDLTAKMRADGTLDWVPPSGRWRILRLGHSLVGTTNHPATAEATGLEVDKFDGRAVRDYLQTYIGMMRSAAGADLVGDKGLRAIVTDSIEVGPSNWTPQLIERFRAARGYDPTPWLPALTGTVIESREASDRFLHDFRATLAELMSSEHYAQVAEVAHANKLKIYGEALEAGRPTLGSEIAMRAHSDVPMAALWTYDRKRGPRTGLLGDMKGASSVSHIYGQNVTAAESLTAAFSPWAFAPRDLKSAMDLEFAYGINRPVIHTSVHQPVDDRQPGLSLGPFGQYFNRHETWAKMAKPWVDYMARSGFMLQQGRNVADVAYFYGEDTPLTVMYGGGVPTDLPQRYAFDFVDRGVVMSGLRNEGDALTAAGGARYRVLYLGGVSRPMTLPVLQRLAALAEGGATIVGLAPPSASPSLADDQAAYAALVGRLWSGQPVTTIGRGRVVASAAIEPTMTQLGITPDFVSGAAKPEDVLFVHRLLPDGDAYFLTHRADEAQRVEARFRVSGKVPELWHADSGATEPVSYRVEGGQTIVPLDLARDDAVFVVFRKNTTATQATVAPRTQRAVASLDGAWNVSFQTGRGAPASVRLATLEPLEKNVDAGIRYFSGTATYTRSFDLPRGVRTGVPLYIDLGAIGDVAEVRVNGQLAGTVWKAPYRVDISKLVKSGRNALDVRVANLWVNRLVGDAQPGATKVAYTTLPTYLPDAPLRPSGLIGPVTLQTEDSAGR